MKFFRKYWPILFILAIALFTRFYRLNHTLTFLEDEGRDLLIIKKMLDTGRPMALGPQTSTGNMYLGPLYYYFITPALWLFGYQPLGPAALLAATGVLTVYLLYYWGSKWFSKTTGILSALLYSLMPSPVYMTRNSWNPNLAPLVSLLYLAVFRQLVLTKKHFFFWVFTLGLLAGTLIQLHYMTLLLFLLTAILYLFHFRSKLHLLFLGGGLAILGFLLPLTPFLIFEVKNHYPNFTALGRYLTSTDQPNLRYSMPLSSWSYRIEVGATRMIGAVYGTGQFDQKLPVNRYLTYTFLFLTVLSLLPSKGANSRRFYLYLVTLFMGCLIVLGAYQENVHLHYLGFLFPFAYLILGYLLATQRRWLTVPSLIFLAVSLSVSLPLTFNYVTTADSIQLTRSRAVADYIAARAGASPYNAVPFRDTQLSTPFAYWLSFKTNPPSNTLASTVFLICVDRPCDQSDYEFDWVFRKGPAHPFIADYLGHPFIDNFTTELELISMEHVSHGIWVAETKIPPSP